MGVNRPIRQEEIDAKYDALGRRGHHMDQFVPEHERVRMMAAAGDPAAQAAQAKQAIEARLNGGGGGGGGAGWVTIPSSARAWEPRIPPRLRRRTTFTSSTRSACPRGTGTGRTRWVTRASSTTSEQTN